MHTCSQVDLGLSVTGPTAVAGPDLFTCCVLKCHCLCCVGPPGLRPKRSCIQVEGETWVDAPPPISQAPFSYSPPTLSIHASSSTKVTAVSSASTPPRKSLQNNLQPLLNPAWMTTSQTVFQMQHPLLVQKLRETEIRPRRPRGLHGLPGHLPAL